MGRTTNGSGTGRKYPARVQSSTVRPLRWQWRAVALGLVTGLVLCGAAAADWPVASAAQPARPVPASRVAHESARRLLVSAVKATDSARSVLLTGTVEEGGLTFGMSLALSSGGTSKGSIDVGGETIRLLRVHKTIYFSGDRAFWTRIGGPVEADVFAGMWIDAPGTSRLFSPLAPILDERFVSYLFPDPARSSSLGSATWTRASGTSVVDHRRVVPLIGTYGPGTAVLLDVAADGEPYITHLGGTYRQSGVEASVDLSRYNERVTATVPKRCMSLGQVERGGLKITLA